MQIHLLWYILAIVFLIVAIIYGAIAASNFDHTNDKEARQQAGLAIYFFLLAITLAILGIIQQGRDAWNYKMKAAGEAHHRC